LLVGGILLKDDVIKRILETVRNKGLRDKLIQKVKNDEDLTLQESRMVYEPVEFGEQLPMTKKRPIDIEWTDHAEYRGELRSIQPDEMNETVKNKVRDRFLKKPNSRAKEKFKSTSGTAVVDFNTGKNPAKADIVTTWASKEGEINMLKFASTKEALQHLSDVTGKRIKIATSSRYIPMLKIKDPKEIDKEAKDFAQDLVDKNEGSKLYPTLAGIMGAKYRHLHEEYQRLLKTFNKVEKSLDDVYNKMSDDDIERLDITII